MSPEARVTLTTLLVLRQELTADRAALGSRHDEVAGVLATWTGAPPPRPYLIFAAAALHAYYTALETGLERVARHVDGAVPSGDRSHQELLAQALVEIPGLRPAVLPPALGRDLNALLGFRHFFRHAYALDLDADKLRLELDRLVRVHPAVTEALERFDAFLAAAAASLAPAP